MTVKISKQFYAAYQKGRQAYRTHGDRAVCPYPDLRGGKYGQVVTFSRAFRKFWWAGFEDEKAGRKGSYTK